MAEREEGTGGETASEKTTSCRYTKWISPSDKGGASYPRLHSNYFLSFCAAQKRELIKFVNCKMHLVTPAPLESLIIRTPSRHSLHLFLCVGDDALREFNKVAREAERSTFVHV